MKYKGLGVAGRKASEGRGAHGQRTAFVTMPSRGMSLAVGTLTTKEALVAEGTAALEDLPTDVLVAAVQLLKATRTSLESTDVKSAIAHLVELGGWGSVNLQYQQGRLVGVDFTVKKRS